MPAKPNKKKPSINKPPAKKRVNKKRRGKKSSTSKRNILIILALFLIFSLIAFGYFLGKESMFDTPSNTVVDKEVVTKVKPVAKKVDEVKVKTVVEKIQVEKVQVKNIVEQKAIVEEKVIVEETKKIEEKVEIVEVEEVIVSKKEKISLAYRSKRAKLVVVIDDVHTKAQIGAIKALNMRVTPSIFPPFALAAKSHLLARGLKHYMVHLPMESGNAQLNTQYKTLKTSFSKEKIQSRVKEIRKLFPTAKYVNNHTGSVFTADYKSMRLLYVALRNEGFIFVDSLTTGSSKVRKIAHSFGDAYVARDTFIDNIHTVPAIHKQLRKAVKLAQKNGYALVIGHPHKVTMKALASANKIFKDIDIVYIDEIYR